MIKKKIELWKYCWC